MTKLLKLHHSAYRCKDSEETRKFYEEFLELKLVKVLEIKILKLIEKLTLYIPFIN